MNSTGGFDPLADLRLNVRELSPQSCLGQVEIRIVGDHMSIPLTTDVLEPDALFRTLG